MRSILERAVGVSGCGQVLAPGGQQTPAFTTLAPTISDRNDGVTSAERSPDWLPIGSTEASRARASGKRRLHSVERSGRPGGAVIPVLDRVARHSAGILGVTIALVSPFDRQRPHFYALARLAGIGGIGRNWSDLEAGPARSTGPRFRMRFAGTS